MTTAERALTFRGDLDVPAGLPRGIDLGRIDNKEKAIAMYGRDTVERLADHALLADDYAYQAMLDFKDKSNNASWRTFDRALEHGIDAIDDPTPGLAALFAQLDRVPEWVDFDQLYRGAVAFWRAGPVVPPVLAWGAIGGGFSMYSSTRPVLFSGRLRHTDHVGTRLIESFRYVVAAYTPGGMRRFEEGFRLTAKVRMIHAAVRHSLSHSNHWDWADWGIPINNLDSMVTQAGQFGVKFTDAVQSFGIRFSDRELEDIFALSRYVGYVIGVPEEILHTDYADARRKTDIRTCRSVSSSSSGLPDFFAARPALISCRAISGSEAANSAIPSVCPAISRTVHPGQLVGACHSGSLRSARARAKRVYSSAANVMAVSRSSRLS